MSHPIAIQRPGTESCVWWKAETYAVVMRNIYYVLELEFYEI